MVCRWFGMSSRTMRMECHYTGTIPVWSVALVPDSPRTVHERPTPAVPCLDSYNRMLTEPDTDHLSATNDWKIIEDEGCHRGG